MDEYFKIVAQLPLPTAAQTEAFAKHVTKAHSWYKHLPAFPPGQLFTFFLDPQAGRSVAKQIGPERFRGIVVSDVAKHPSYGPFTMSKTDDYRCEFGYWNYQHVWREDWTKHPVRVFTTEPVPLDPERQKWLEVGLPVEVPPALLEQCSCRLTAFISGGVLCHLPKSKLPDFLRSFEGCVNATPNSPHLENFRRLKRAIEEMSLSSNSSDQCQITIGEPTCEISLGREPLECELAGFGAQQTAQQRKNLLETLLRSREVFGKLCNCASGVVSSGTSRQTIRNQTANLASSTDDYLKVVAQLPLPTEEQTLAFANQVIALASKEEYLPFLPPGVPVVFYLDPQAGRALKRRIVSTVPWLRNPPEHLARVALEIEDAIDGHVATDFYRAKFGYWHCAINPQIDPEIYSVERIQPVEGCNPAFEVAVAVPVSEQVIQQTSCPLTALIKDYATATCSLEELRQRLQELDETIPRMTDPSQVRRFLSFSQAFRRAANFSGCARQVDCHLHLGLDAKHISVVEKISNVFGQPKRGREAVFQIAAESEIREERDYQRSLLRHTLLRAREFFSQYCLNEEGAA